MKLKVATLFLLCITRLLLADCELYDNTVWSYTIVDGKSRIHGNSSPTPVTSGADTLRIPDKLGGCPVVEIDGVLSVDWNTKLFIPASVTAICGRLLGDTEWDTVKQSRLQWIDVDSANSYYKSVDGCLYTKDGKTLIRFPEGRKGKVQVAADWTDAASVTFVITTGGLDYEAASANELATGLLTLVNW